MGRYYTGDIQGKFWVSVQPSDTADQFGGEAYTPETIEYYFDLSHLDAVMQRLLKIENELGVYRERLDKFFKDCTGYTDEQVLEAIGCTVGEVNNLLRLYSDYLLGCQIRDCVLTKGECSFIAELN